MCIGGESVGKPAGWRPIGLPRRAERRRSTVREAARARNRSVRPMGSLGAAAMGRAAQSASFATMSAGWKWRDGACCARILFATPRRAPSWLESRFPIQANGRIEKRDIRICALAEAVKHGRIREFPAQTRVLRLSGTRTGRLPKSLPKLFRQLLELVLVTAVAEHLGLQDLVRLDAGDGRDRGV